MSQTSEAALLSTVVAVLPTAIMALVGAPVDLTLATFTLAWVGMFGLFRGWWA